MRYFVTGHTGFKGAWLTLWLEQLGHSVHGFGLDPEPGSLFDIANVASIVASDKRGDIRDEDLVKRTIHAVQPDVIIHLAAQALVRESYRNPRQTYETNVIGTLNVLEAVGTCESVQAQLVVTTDKVYRNVNQNIGYVESDALGGDDPYSGSKAMTELLTHSWVTSFEGPSTATARAGNVIGGGDISSERLMPDLIKACESGHGPVLRYPQAVRPWQHVLDCVNGYLQLVDYLLMDSHTRSDAGSWNFGPDNTNFISVGELTAMTLSAYESELTWDTASSNQFHEASTLTLDSNKARSILNWRDKLSLPDAVRWTVDWHKSVTNGQDPFSVTREQISRFLVRN